MAILKMLPSSVEEGVGGGAECEFKLLTSGVTTPALGAPPLMNQEGSFSIHRGSP